MKTVMADGLSSQQLARSLQQRELSVLLLDCRSFMDYNNCHIQTSHNVHCPSIVKRRSGGVLSLENIIRCGVTRSKLLGGVYGLVVVYDEDKTSVAHLASEPDSIISLVLRSLTEHADIKDVHFLEGKLC